MIKILITLSLVTIFTISSLGVAGEMERYYISTNNLSGIESLRTSSPMSSMDPIFSNANWEGKLINYMEQGIKKSIINSVPNPSDIYVGRKFENDVLKVLNTALAVGTATGGNPLSIASATNNIIRNFGPQSGAVQDTTGHIGDILFITNTGRNILSGNYSDAVIGVTNRAIGGTVDAQRKTLREPIITSDLKHYQIKTNDGFTRVESVGSVGVTKTYTPPQAVRPFGPPDIFEGSTKITTKSNSITRIETGNFNNSFNTNTYISPPFKNYQTPSLNNFNNYKPTTFKSPTFSPSFNTSGFNSFGRIR